MSLSSISIKRPIFISCVVLLMLAVGLLALRGLPVDLFPNITFPVVRVLTPYPGAGPSEVETLVSKVLEDEMSNIPGIKTLSSINREGLSIVVGEFTLETDIKFAEQQMRDRVSSAKAKLPSGIKESIIKRLDPSDQPILMVSLTGDLPPAELFDLADQRLKPKLEQLAQVGLVDIVGGRKREIHVKLDRKKLKAHELSATTVAARIAAAGQNVPAGKYDQDSREMNFRTLGEFHSLDDIGNTIVSFLGSDVPVTVNGLGRVTDTLEDETSRSTHNGAPTLILQIYRQSGANTVAVADAAKARVQSLNEEFKNQPGKPKLTVVRDGAKMIRANVDDVRESISIGIVLTILVVFLFLGNIRSTLITGLALPNSLIGAFILMAAAGFSINVMTLLALSLTVGLLIDDAIVVRENIFRHIEMGKTPLQASLEGTKEVTLAVIATTLTVIAVFGPIGFLQGVVGRFFREFGLTICFAMAISLFDALAVAPMLSAYFAGKPHQRHSRIYDLTLGRIVNGFDRFQTRLENHYVRILGFALKSPIAVLVAALAVFALSIVATRGVPKTFLPPQDIGEFQVALDLPPGTNLDAMNEVAGKVDRILRGHPEVKDVVMIAGGSLSPANQAVSYVMMTPRNERKMDTTAFKEVIRNELKPFAFANPRVQDVDMVGAGMRPFNVNIIGDDLKQLESHAQAVYGKLRNHPGLKDVDISYRPGKPEYQVILDSRHAESLGVSTASVGMELRAQIEGLTPSVFREAGREYDVRVRLQEDQRNLREGFGSTFVPNINFNLVRLQDIANGKDMEGPAEITRQDRGRYIRISGDIAPGGVGMGGVMEDTAKMLESGELKLPPGLRYRFVGQAENFKELGESMIVAVGLGILFIYLVLASLYESFVTPFTIMLVLPLAACGAFYALFVTHSSLDLFSMIGCVMLLGIATKNSILLVDYTHQLVESGMDRSAAILQAGKSRLRPILMTTVALIAGMLPVAIGLNEASKQRTSMGVAIIGGLISSTLLTLVVVPAAYSYIDRFRLWSGARIKSWLVS